MEHVLRLRWTRFFPPREGSSNESKGHRIHASYDRGAITTLFLKLLNLGTYDLSKAKTDLWGRINLTMIPDKLSHGPDTRRESRKKKCRVSDDLGIISAKKRYS